MKAITDYSSEDLNALLKDLQIQYQEARAQNLNLNMARGKPAAAQLDLSNELLNKMENYTLADGTDAQKLRYLRRDS